MICRAGCGACCVAPSISAAIPGMSGGKPAGVTCVQLTSENLCGVFNSPDRPGVCIGFKACEEMCGNTRQDALDYLAKLEKDTAP